MSFLNRVTIRRVSAEDRLLVTVLVGHLGLAIQHVPAILKGRPAAMTTAETREKLTQQGLAVALFEPVP